MMNTNFTSTAKRVSNGKKIKYVVFADGKEIGSRTAGRSYQAVLVARRNYRHAVRNAHDNLEGSKKEKARYEGWLANPEAALASEKPGFHRDNLAVWLKDGTCQCWIDGLAKRISETEARISELSKIGQDSPEFSEWMVIAFTNVGKLQNAEWLYQETLVALTQPEAA